LTYRPSPALASILAMAVGWAVLISVVLRWVGKAAP